MEEQSVQERGFSVSESGSVLSRPSTNAPFRSGQSTAVSVKSNGVEVQPSPRSRTPKRRKKHFAVSVAWERQVSEGRVPMDHNTFFCCCAKRVGHMFSLCSYADGTPIVIAGPCWPFCVFVTIPLILGTTFCVSYFLIFGSRFDLVSRSFSKRTVFLSRESFYSWAFLSLGGSW